MPIFSYGVKAALGGKSSKEQFTATFDVEQESALDSGSTRANANAIVGALQHATFEDVYFLRVHVKQRADNPINRPADHFVSVGQTVQGLRPAPVDANGAFAYLLPKEFAINLTRDTSIDRNGRILLPYGLALTDVEQTREGGFSLKANSAASAPIATTIAALKQALPDGQFVIPDKVDTLRELFVQGGRPVINWYFAGVTEAKRNRRRVSVASAVKSAEKRRIRQLVRDARELLGETFTGNVTGVAVQALATIKSEIASALATLSTGESAAILAELPLALL